MLGAKLVSLCKIKFGSDEGGGQVLLGGPIEGARIGGCDTLGI